MINVKPSAPQKNRRRPNAWWMALLILLFAGGAAGWYVFLGPGSVQAQRTPDAPSGGQTFTSPVTRGDLRVSTAGSGILVAYQSVDLSFSTSGTVTEVNVKTGDMVKAGQVLASLGSSETLEANLAAAQLQVLNAQKTVDDLQENAELSLAEAYTALVTAQETYQQAQETSQRMAYSRCGEETALRLAANLDQATDRLANIHAEKAMSDAYIAAKKAYDSALANYNQCAAYDSDDKNSAASNIEVAGAALEEAQGTYDTLQSASGIDPNQLALAQANLNMARAQRASAEKALAGVTITAPVDGKVIYLAAPAEAKVGTNTFITIADTTHAALEISVNEAELSRFVLNAPVIVVFDALPDQQFTGKVVRVNPEVTISGTYRVVKGRVELEESAIETLSALPLGLSASVTLNPQEALDALLAPTIALLKQANGSYAVMVQGSDGRLSRRQVTVGIYDSDYAEITSGLEEGELVSTGTVQFVAAGSTISSDALKNAQNTNGFSGPGGDMPPPGGMP